MALFTYVFVWRGTSAVGQVRAASPRAAVARWAKAFNYGSVLGMKKKDGEALLRGFAEATPLPVKRSKNVWGMATNSGGTLALLHLVRTQEAAGPATSATARKRRRLRSR